MRARDQDVTKMKAQHVTRIRVRDHHLGLVYDKDQASVCVHGQASDSMIKIGAHEEDQGLSM